MKRIIRCFDYLTESYKSEIVLESVDLATIQGLWDIPSDNPMYDCYYIQTDAQIQYVQELTGFILNITTYDYFLECDVLKEAQEGGLVNISPERVVLKSIEGGIPKNIKEIEKSLSAQSENPERLAKEIVWKLVEEGKARFNDDWLLEARLALT